MTQAVRLLKDAIPYYSWVGIYLRNGDDRRRRRERRSALSGVQRRNALGDRRADHGRRRRARRDRHRQRYARRVRRVGSSTAGARGVAPRRESFGGIVAHTITLIP